MTQPWEAPAVVPYYDTIAAAEAAIVAAGYVRHPTRHVWVNGNRTAKVVRDDTKEKDKFFVEWG